MYSFIVSFDSKIFFISIKDVSTNLENKLNEIILDIIGKVLINSS